MPEGSLPADRANRIADAVEEIEHNVSRLREFQHLSHEEYTDPAEQDRRDAIERKFVKLAEATLDIATQLCKQERSTLPEMRKERVAVLADEGIVDESLAERLRSALGFRDVLAHTYRADREQRAIVEREFQTAIEACIDIAGLLLRGLGRPVPETYAKRFPERSRP